MKKIICTVLTLFILLNLTACSNGGTSKSETKTVNLFVLSGPTGIGSLNLWDRADKGQTELKYNVTLTASNDEIVAAVSNGTADIAAVATNLASSLYNKTNGKISVLAVNTASVLSLLSKQDIKSVSDLKGKTLYTIGQGANPEYILNYILKGNGLDPKSDLDINFLGDGSELLTVWSKNPDDVIMAPQPVATSLLLSNPETKKVLDMGNEWEKISKGSALVMGCVIANNNFIKNNPNAVKTFLKEYEDSVNAAKSDIDTTALLCEQKGIIPKAAVAKKSIPECGITFISGKEMKKDLSGYLKVMYEQNPKSVGGKLPSADFYYEEK